MVRLCRRRTIALLAYLVVEPGPHRRESLLALLWPECGPEKAHAYLRNALWELGKSPIGPWLDADGDSVELRFHGGVDVDVVRFRALMARADKRDDGELPDAAAQVLATAVELYRGDFLAGFTLPDSPPFDEWQERHAEALKQQLGVMLERLIRHHLSRGEAALAVDLGSRWIGLDTLDEATYQRLMELYSSAGYHELALRQFELCRCTMNTELGAQPSEDTCLLCEHIKGMLRQRSMMSVAEEDEVCLPIASTPFVGRQRELEELARLLGNSRCRLITLVGYGGSGKSRLAVEAAVRWRRATGSRLAVVSLADRHSLLDAVLSIVDAFSLGPLVGGVDRDDCPPDDLSVLLGRLVAALREAHGLLVVDNAEHLEGIDRIVHALIEGNVGVQLLVTSRHRLGLRAEITLPVEGLPCPDEQSHPEQWTACPAVQLFLGIARRVCCGFTPNEADLRAIGKACTLLGGAPLGIELAAGWIGTLSCAGVADEIERGMAFLATEEPDVPVRHRSLRAVFEHSWVLLPPDVGWRFLRLALFRGGFTRDAAAEVAEVSTETLAELANRSLIHQVSPSRYDVHQVLRQFARERLEEDPAELALVADRHARFFLREVACVAPRLETGDQREAITALEADARNITHAWCRCVDRGLHAEIRAAAFGLFLYFDMTSRTREGAELFRRGAQAGSLSKYDADHSLRAFLAVCHGWFLCSLRPMQGNAEMERGVRTLRHSPPSRHVGVALALLGIERTPLSPSRASHLLAESCTVFERIKDRWGLALAFEGLSFAMVRSDADAAHRSASRSLSIRAELGDAWGISMAYMALGNASRFRGDTAVARQHYERSLATRREFGVDRIGVCHCMWHLASTDLSDERYGEAMQRFAEAAAMARQIGDPCMEVRCLAGKARAARGAGNADEFLRCLEEGMALSVECGDTTEQAHLLSQAACFEIGRGEAAAAQRAVEHAMALDQANPQANLVAARISLVRGLRSDTIHYLEAALRSARVRQHHGVITDIGLVLAGMRIEDHEPDDAVTLARAVLRHSAPYPAGRTRAERILQDLGVSETALDLPRVRRMNPSLDTVVAAMLKRVSTCAGRSRATGTDGTATRSTAGVRRSYRRRIHGRDVLKLPAVMCAK